LFPEKRRPGNRAALFFAEFPPNAICIGRNPEQETDPEPVKFPEQLLGLRLV
jgi:hypothetical protein